jgi:hypothetical protein
MHQETAVLVRRKVPTSLAGWISACLIVLVLVADALLRATAYVLSSSPRTPDDIDREALRLFVHLFGGDRDL